MRILRTIGTAFGIAVLLAGCGVIGNLPGLGQPAVVADLEVYNRTEMEITLVAADGEVLVVPACSSARDPDFRVDQVRVGAENLYVHAFGAGGGEPGQQLTLVEVAESADSVIEQGPPPDPLPPCLGRPQVQQGVPLFD